MDKIMELYRKFLQWAQESAENRMHLGIIAVWVTCILVWTLPMGSFIWSIALLAWIVSTVFWLANWHEHRKEKQK